MKDWILEHTALNQRELARLVEWSPSSFNQWLKGNRPIPKPKQEALAEVLEDYGYRV